MILWIACWVLAFYTLFSLVYYLFWLRPRLQAHSESCQKQEKALNEWKRIFDVIADPVLILDHNRRITRGNRAAVQLLSPDSSSLEGKTCHSLFAGAETPCPFCFISSICAENESHHQEITHNYLGRTFMISCFPVLEEGQIVGFVVTAKDISHQRNLEKQLIHAHKMESIATLAGGIAHDFNNILGAILGNADLLLYRMPAQNKDGNAPLFGPPLTTPELVEHLQAIRQAGHRAKDLVSQILAFSRQSTHKRQDLFVSPLVKETCRLLRSTLPATIDIKVSISDRIDMIHADPGQIQQIVMQLCTNAAQSLENQCGTIEISLRQTETGKAEQYRYHGLQPGSYVVLTVKDTGKGISKEAVERIFDPYFTTHEVGKGSGLGLAVLHGIVTAHEGVIDVSSTPGKGTVFTVFFPCITRPKEIEPEQGDFLPGGSETILFVDDEEEIVKMRTRMLAHLGYRVFAASTPERALQYFEKEDEQIDLMITDHTMPRMTGLQLAGQVSRLRPGLPIILCSGYSEAVTMEEAKRCGVHRFLAKPVDMRLLARAIREILPDKKGVEDENLGN